MKDPQQLISLIVTAGYMLYRIFMATKPPKKLQKNIEKNEIDKETKNYQKKINSSLKEVKKLLQPITSPIATKPKITALVDPFRARNKRRVNFTYPGIKKLLLPTQEKDPYKLYKATLPTHSTRLNKLLSKYRNSQKKIIIATLLQRKTWL